jgi:S-formylglutathione hydrolase FrmB
VGDWIRALYGPDVANWRDHDPASLAAKLTPGQIALYLDAGTEDDLLLNNGAMYLHDLLLAKHYDHAWYLGPGHHAFTFWAERVGKSLAFLRDHTNS